MNQDDLHPSDEIRKFPPGFVYHPASEPPVSRRECITVKIFSWIIAILLHCGFFYVAGLIVEYASADVEITMNWSEEPLTGFGMMDIYEEEEAVDVPPTQVDADEDPFEEEPDEVIEPSLDPDSIVIPEPEPEPDPNAEPDPEAKPDESVPAYDLTRDKKRLEAVRSDVGSMPNLHVLAPGNARLIVLIRNDRVKGCRFENSIRRLFKAFPDYRFTLGASDIDPVNDIDAMLIATANPNLYAETFLVVAHRIPGDKLREYIGASFPTSLKWEEHNHRPLAVPDNTDGKYHPKSGIYKRAVYLSDEHTVLFLKPEVLPTLEVAHVDAIVKARDDELENNDEKAETFLQSLGAISTSDSVSMPTLFMMVQGIESINLGSGFPAFETPKAVMASLSTADRPHLNMEATFGDEKSAKAFVDVWPDILSAAGGLGIPGLGALLGGLALAPEKEKVLITGDLNGTMIGLILMFAAQHLEKNA